MTALLLVVAVAGTVLATVICWRKRNSLTGDKQPVAQIRYIFLSILSEMGSTSCINHLFCASYAYNNLSLISNDLMPSKID